MIILNNHTTSSTEFEIKLEFPARLFHIIKSYYQDYVIPFQDNPRYQLLDILT